MVGEWWGANQPMRVGQRGEWEEDEGSFDDVEATKVRFCSLKEKQWTDTDTALVQASRWILYLAPVIPRRSRTSRCCEVFNLPLCGMEETTTARE